MLFEPRALVVDDFQDTAEITSTLLHIIGCDSRFTTCGREALGIIASWRPSLVICDLGLPDIGGCEIVRMVRTTCHWPLYAIAFTGWARPEDRVCSCEAGFDDYYLKPVSRPQLEAIVSRVRAMA